MCIKRHKGKKVLTKDGLCYRLVVPFVCAGMIGGNLFGGSTLIHMEDYGMAIFVAVFAGYLSAVGLCLWWGGRNLGKYIDIIYEGYKEQKVKAEIELQERR